MDSLTGPLLMLTTVMHAEDIKAELRKRHGTVARFALVRGLKAQSLADWLRGRTSAPVAEAVARELECEGHLVVGQSMNMDNSAADQSSHRLNAGAK